MYSGLRSLRGLGKSDLNTEVTVLPKLISYFFTRRSYLSLNKGERNGGVTMLDK